MAPILAPPDNSWPFRIEADSLYFATGAILSQQSPEDNKWHPIAFLSKCLSPVEQNYKIHDKEMLAIVRALEEWRHFVEGAEHRCEIWTDHKNLQYFMTAKKLNRRQARWSLLLAWFDFIMHHCPGKSMGRWMLCHVIPITEQPGRTTTTWSSLLQTSSRSEHWKAWRQQGRNEEYWRISRRECEMGRKRNQWQGLWRNYKVCQLAPWHQQSAPYPTNFCISRARSMFWTPPISVVGLLHFLTTLGWLVTVEDGKHWNWCLGITGDCRCQGMLAVCLHLWHVPPDQVILMSSDQRTPPIPSALWDTISVDFIVELPQSAGHNSIMVVINSVTKHAHFVSTVTMISATRAAHLFLNHVWKHHGLPQKVVSNRGPQFVAEFTQELYRFLGINLAATTAYHPQGDGQTEWVNQELEQYLCLFTNQRQDDWVGLLPFVEFQYNNQVHSSC